MQQLLKWNQSKSCLHDSEHITDSMKETTMMRFHLGGHLIQFSIFAKVNPFLCWMQCFSCSFFCLVCKLWFLFYSICNCRTLFLYKWRLQFHLWMLIICTAASVYFPWLLLLILYHYSTTLPTWVVKLFLSLYNGMNVFCCFVFGYLLHLLHLYVSICLCVDR